MLIACWAPKGGSGATTVAVSLALLAASEGAGHSLLVDLAGEAAAVMGMADPAGPGLTEWLGAPRDVGVDVIEGLAVEATGGVRLLAGASIIEPGSASTVDEARVELLAAWLDGRGEPTIADCGGLETPVSRAVASGGAMSLAVLRPCYLALRRALAAPVKPSGVVLVVDEGRSLGPADVSDVLGVPVVAQVPLDPAVARSVDAGLLARRLPRSLARSLRQVSGSAQTHARLPGRDEDPVARMGDRGR